MNIGEKIYELREKFKISQQELADILDVSRQTVSKWECGNSDPEVSKIVKIANYFKVTTDFLLDNELSDSDKAKKEIEEKQVKVKQLHKLFEYQKQVIEKFYLNNPDYNKDENFLFVNQPHCQIVLNVKKITNDTIFIPSIVEKVALVTNYFGTGLKIEIEDKIDNLEQMFKGRELSTIDLTNFDANKVKSLEGFLSSIRKVNCIKGFNKLDLSNHKSLRALFKDSTIGVLENINDMNVSTIEDFRSIFSTCKIEDLNLSNWDISSMRTAERNEENLLPISSYLFYRAVITNLNLSNWDLGSIRHTIAWFSGSKITNLDISKWNMKNIVNCSGLFNSAMIKNGVNANSLNINSSCNTTGMFDLFKG